MDNREDEAVNIAMYMRGADLVEVRKWCLAQAQVLNGPKNWYAEVVVEDAILFEAFIRTGDVPEEPANG